VKSKFKAHTKEVCEQLGIRHYRFKSEEDFNLWFEQMQIETLSYYPKHKGASISKKTGRKVYYRNCQHHQTRQTELKKLVRKTNRRKTVGSVPNYNCPSKLTIGQQGHTIDVQFKYEHNHPCTVENLKYQPYPASVRKEIMEMLSAGFRYKEIFAAIQRKRMAEKSSTTVVADKRDLMTER
jgi:hypothetical protein